MTTLSHATLTRELDEARAFLRDFTNGRRGFTQQDGKAGIRRVTDACTRLEEALASGARAHEAAAAVAAAKEDIEAAKDRLNVLKGER